MVRTAWLAKAIEAAKNDTPKPPYARGGARSDFAARRQKSLSAQQKADRDSSKTPPNHAR